MIQYLRCNRCGKVISTPFKPEPTDTPDKGIIIRAWIECPECIENKQEPQLYKDGGPKHEMGQ